MSVAAHPHPRKRYFEAEENEDRFQRLSDTAAGLKRTRQQLSPSGRCAPECVHQGAYSVGQSTVTALHALFPEMNDKVRLSPRGVWRGGRLRWHAGIFLCAPRLLPLVCWYLTSVRRC